MKKSSRQAIYDWVERHKDDYGKVRTSTVLSMADYNRVRANILKNHKYAKCDATRINDNRYSLVISIRSKEEVEQLYQNEEKAS